MKKLTTLFCLLFSVTFMVAEVSTKQKNALTDLYIATNGDDWTNSWDLDTDVNSWYGITVENDNVIAINLLFNNLTGTLPSTLSQLNYLEKLELSFNKIEGNIPVSIGLLSNLEVFAINGNSISGKIPESMGQLGALEQLHLSSNNLVGNIPLSLARLSNLEVLNVFDNNLSGLIPLALSENDNLKKLVVAENNLIGTASFVAVMLFDENNSEILFDRTEILINAKTVIANQGNNDNN